MAPVNDMCPIPKALLRINVVLSMPLFLSLCLSLLTLPQISAHASGGGLFVGRGCGAGAPLRETGRAPLARRLCAAARADPRASRLPRLGRRLGDVGADEPVGRGGVGRCARRAFARRAAAAGAADGRASSALAAALSLAAGSASLHASRGSSGACRAAPFLHAAAAVADAALDAAAAAPLRSRRPHSAASACAAACAVACFASAAACADGVVARQWRPPREARVVQRRVGRQRVLRSPRSRIRRPSRRPKRLRRVGRRTRRSYCRRWPGRCLWRGSGRCALPRPAARRAVGSGGGAAVAASALRGESSHS
jgi:hypothetical protein